MQRRRLKLVVSSILVIALLLFSAMSVASMVNGEESTKFLIEIDNEGQMEYLQEHSDVLVDYENGRYLVEVPASRAENIRSRYDMTLDETRYQIHVDTIRDVFDRREGTPELSEELMEETGAYIVQFAGPVRSVEWKEQVIEAGASVEREMANYALLVRMDDRTKSRVENLDIVEWVDPYYSGYKLSPELLSPEEDMVRVQVRGWTAEDDIIVREQLNEMGATLGRMDSTGSIANVDSTLIPSIAALEGVRRVDPYYPAEPKDNVANEIHEVQAAWYPSWSGLPVELTGEGEVVGVQDTGFDEGELLDNPDNGNPDFYQPENRVIRYTDREGGSDPDGINAGVAHGSHVAGIIGGDGANWRSHLDLNTDGDWHQGEGTGVAPEVEFSLDGTVDDRGGFYPTHEYWDDQEADGARVFQNSWGATATGDYAGDSEDVDERMDPYSGNAMPGAPENIIMFSAGNDGPELHTMTPRPMAKNTIAVGASQNYRSGEYMNADNPDYVADFSSRGGPDFSDGRIKPDVVAAGTAMISAFARGEYEFNDGDNPGSWIMDVNEYAPGGNEDVPDYQYMQGTSMAGPQAAGMAALIRQYYREMHDIEEPTNPLVKATMINGAERMDPDLYDYPGYDQGWGRPNLRKSLYPSAPQSNQFAEGTFEETGTWDAATDGGMELEVNSNEIQLKATLTWLDSSGMEMNRQLHMYAESPSGEMYYSGVDNYDEDGWTTAGSTQVDTVNTVQRIEIQDPEPGTWTLTVQADNIPSPADFAVATSADFGPQEDFDVDVSTDYHTIQSLASGGTTHLPIEVANWGNNADTIELSDNSPTELTVSYEPVNTLSLDSTEIANLDLTMTADDGLDEQIIEFEITATSQDDPSNPPAADTIRMTIQILTEPLPYRETVADSDADEMFPDIITFTDSGGTDWIFAAYQQVTPDGVQVRVKYSELGGDGRPVEWQGPFNPMSANPTEDPNYVELQHIDSGTYEDRVVVYWNGATPGSGGEEFEAKASWADPGSYDIWNAPSQIDNNYGDDQHNMKRGSYMVFRDDGTADGELMYVFEHLDFDGDWTPTNIGIAYVISNDGGETWEAADDIPGAGGDGGYFYFFPNGITDQNDVNWHFFYYREDTGDQRMVVTILQDNDGWSDEVQVVGSLEGDPVDNHQFPMAEHYNNEGVNEIYVSSIYDNSGDFSDLTAAFITGDYSSTNPPADGDFTSYDNVAGNDVSEEDMTAADILGKAAGGDGWIWTSYLETDTVFDVPNVNVARSEDQYNSVTVDYVTRDNYRKLNPSMASKTIDGTSYAYVAYHSSQGTTREVDHEVFISVLHSDWETEPDTEGPLTSHVSANPNPVDLSTDTSFDLTGSIDDTMTGGSDIQAAEYIETDTTVTDPTTIDWNGASEMVISGSSPTEIATAEGLSIPSHWESGNMYRYWVRGQDTADNWGTVTADYVDIEVTGERLGTMPPTDPNPEDGVTGVTTDLELSVYVEHDDGDNMDVYFYDASDDTLIGEDNNVASGSRAYTTWNGLDYDTTYNWYAVADDGEQTATSDTWSFTTEEPTPPEITITRPTGGEVWNAGDDQEITWDTTAGDGDITDIDLEYSVDGGASYEVIQTGLDDTGSYFWTVPDQGTEEARIRGTVNDEYGSSNQDESGLFTIEGTTPPQITITRPEGGEEWTVGDNEDITWETTAGDGDITTIDIEYSVDGGVSYEVIQTGLDDTGSYLWTVPDEITDEARIRATVHDTNDHSDVDESNLFSIIGIPPEPPQNLNVEHTGTVGEEELVENGIFQENYDPWTLTEEVAEGYAGWDAANHEEGGSIHVSITEDQSNVESTQEAHWEQAIGPTSNEITVNGAYYMNLVTNQGGNADATVELQVYDTGPGSWETIHSESNADDIDTGWTEFGTATYTPEGEVEAVRAYMLSNAEGSNMGDGSVDLWMDAISITAEGSGDGTEDNLITWDASLDDPDSVTNYNIYRNETEDGYYELIATVDADGSASYEYIDEDRGTADDIYWWYIVHAVNEEGQECEGAGPVQEPGAELSTFDIELSADEADGWNFVSFNLNLGDTNLESILDDVDNGITGNYEKVMYYDATADEWYSYVPGRDDHFNNIDTWDHTMGIWIQMNEVDTLTVEGQEPEETTISLEAGWNMVSYPSSEAGTGVPDQVTEIGYFDATAEYNVAYTEEVDTFEFTPGDGYWLYAEEPTEWTVQY